MPTPELAVCPIHVPTILILNDNQPQLFDGKGTTRRSLVHPSGLYAHERSFVLVWTVMEENRYEKSTVLSKITMVVDLHEESGTIDQQVNANLSAFA